MEIEIVESPISFRLHGIASAVENKGRDPDPEWVEVGDCRRMKTAHNIQRYCGLDLFQIGRNKQLGTFRSERSNPSLHHPG